MSWNTLVSYLRVGAVLAVGIPIVLALYVFYYLRRLIFKVPIQGYWSERGQCEAYIKGPNTWN